MKSLRSLFVGFASFAMLAVAFGSIGPALALDVHDELALERIDTSFDLLFVAPDVDQDVRLHAVICPADLAPILPPLPPDREDAASSDVRVECTPSIGRDPPAD